MSETKFDTHTEPQAKLYRVILNYGRCFRGLQTEIPTII
jgi:hypothetical protein